MNRKALFDALLQASFSVYWTNSFPIYQCEFNCCIDLIFLPAELILGFEVFCYWNVTKLMTSTVYSMENLAMF